MKQKLIISLFVIFTCSEPLSAQTDNQSIKSFTLQEAVDYALSNNMNYQNVLIDEQMALMKKKEIRGIGLPQISSSFDLKDYEKLPTQLLPGQFFGGPPGSYIPVQFGTQYNATGTIQASQILFNSDYIIALQSSKSFLELSQKNTIRSKIETTVSVSKAYYNVLVSKERLKLMDAQIVRVKKLLDDTKAMNQNGVVEKIDVDRVTLTYNNLITEKEKILRLIGVSESLLKFQMGFELQTPFLLTDSLDIKNVQTADIPLTEKFNYQNRIEYSLLQSQLELNQLDIKRGRMRQLPSLVMYGSLSYQAQRNQFDFFDNQQSWYPIGIIGATFSLPIFDGLQNHYRIEQSKLNLIKTTNNMTFMESAIDFEIQMSLTNYQNSLASIKTQQESMKLAEEIFDVAKKKYDQGAGSILEVTNAETSLKETLTNYYNALYEYYIAKIDYDKANGTIK